MPLKYVSDFATKKTNLIFLFNPTKFLTQTLSNSKVSFAKKPLYE